MYAIEILKSLMGKNGKTMPQSLSTFWPMRFGELAGSKKTCTMVQFVYPNCQLKKAPHLHGDFFVDVLTLSNKQKPYHHHEN